MKTRLAIVSLLVCSTASAAEVTELASWREATADDAPAYLTDLLPAHARLVDARAGEMFRLRGNTRPVVGRLWRAAETLAFVDESDTLIVDGKTGWTWVVPLGAHQSVVVAGDVIIERAVSRDPGYGWEVYEDQLVSWGDGNTTDDPPAPPAGDARAAWIEARATSALLRDAGALDHGGRSLRAAVALGAVAVSRPLAGPYYRDAGVKVAGLTSGVGKVNGPTYVQITAVAAAPGKAASVRILLDGAPVGGGALALGPGTSTGLTNVTADPSEWTIRIPRGAHKLEVQTGGAPKVTAVAFHKREHVADALSGNESIDGRATEILSGHPLVAADARRLLGQPARAREAFGALVTDGNPAVQVYAAWRAGELAADATSASRAFAIAEEGLKRLDPETRARVVPALALARLRRASTDGLWKDAAAAAAISPEVWASPDAALALAGADGDQGAATARLAAAVAAAPPAAVAALRRAFYDRTVWRTAPLYGPTMLVFSKDPEGSCVAETGDAYHRLDTAAVKVRIPADPLGTGRFLRTRLVAFAPTGPALDAMVVVDGTAIPVPVLTGAEEHHLALAAGEHQLAIRGDASFYLHIPGAEPTEEQVCSDRHRRRRYAQVGAAGAEAFKLPIQGPAGAVVGVDLRVLDPKAGEVMDLVLRADGRERPMKLRADSGVAGGAAKPVSPAVVVDLVAHDPATLAVSRVDGGQGILLARPLLRITRPAPESAILARAAAIAARLLGGKADVVPGDAPDADLRRLSTQIAATKDANAQAKLLFLRARILAALGRVSYAEEDLRRAEAVAPQAGYDVLRDASAGYVEAPADKVAGYTLDPTARLLHELAGDKRAQQLAERAHGGAPTAAHAAVAADRARHPGAGGNEEVDDATLAITARFDDRDGDEAGAAVAYATLARRHPDDKRLSVAEAHSRLDAIAGGDVVRPGSATRAYLAALRGDGAPGSGDALARAADATRWRAVSHADQAAGSQRGPLAATADRPGLAIRNALAAPDLTVDSALWVEAGQVGRAVFDLPKPAHILVDTRCAELRPAAALQRSAAPACRLEVKVDGVASEAGDLGTLPAGAHAIEVKHAAGGLDALAAVRFTTDAAIPGANLRPAGAGRYQLGARMEQVRFIADVGEPLVIAVLGPTVLHLDVAGDGVVVKDDKAEEPLAELAAGPADLPLAEERAYRVEVRPRRGRSTLLASVREDRTTPSAGPLQPALGFAAPDMPPAGASPEAPRTTLRFVGNSDTVGTITVSGEVRDGHVGDRDSTTDRGGRYAETAVAYRRQTGDTYVRADALGRLRTEGDPSGGLGVRGMFMFGELRLTGGVLAMMQNSDTGTAAAVWVDGALALRHALGRDFFFTPTVGALLRFGDEENPGGVAIDPDVWSQYDADRPQRYYGQLRLDWEPFLDLHARTRVRAATMGTKGLDTAGALVGLTGAIGRFGWGTSVELERRFSVGPRLFGVTRPIARAGVSWALWRGGSDRFSIGAGAIVRADDPNELWVGLSYDWTFGRGLRDFAPDEQEYAAQIGPYAEDL